MIKTLVFCGSRYLPTKVIKSQSAIKAGTFLSACRRIHIQKLSESATAVGTIKDIEQHYSEILGLDKGYVALPKSREKLLEHQPKKEDLPPRSMKDSYISAIIPLKSNKTLQDRYVSFFGDCRMGRLLENMDTFAVGVCVRHLSLPKLPAGVHLPYTFVTIRVDKIIFSEEKANAYNDIRLIGHVSWVGTSSIEVTVYMEQEDNGEYKPITSAYFLMAARNATNSAAAPVNSLKPANDVEKKILEEAEVRKIGRKKVQDSSLSNLKPNPFEESIMYDLYKRTTNIDTLELNQRILPHNSRWMSNSYSINTTPAFPEYRNVQNTVFGGFVMRCALEISWVTAFLYGKSRPKLVRINDITFNKPVRVDSFIQFGAYVTYTKDRYVQVTTVADIIDPLGGAQVTSNVLSFTFILPRNVPEVLPRSYHETMWYIQGRRTFNNAMGIA